MKKPYKRLSEARGAVVRFLKENPLSTSEEIYAATGVGMLSVVKKGMFKNCMYAGKRCWRVVANPESKIDVHDNFTVSPWNGCSEFDN